MSNIYTGLTWRDVLDNKVWYGHISIIQRRAKDTGYLYFLWNDRVYVTPDDPEARAKDTGLTVTDIK